MAVGIRPSLPFKGIHLLLGNDLAGDKVVVNPLLTSTPCVDQPPDPIEEEIPDLYPSCAVTRAMAKKAKLYDGMQDINLTDTLIGQSFQHLFPLVSLIFRLTLAIQGRGQKMTFHLPTQMTKVMTTCQGHSFVKNNTVILRSRLYLKGLLMKMKYPRFLFAIMSKMAY